MRAALIYLQRRYNFGARYVLVGHSAGASLAFQVVAGLTSVISNSDSNLVLPRAVVGFEGIYDFCGLDERMGGAYTPFFEGAFGGDRGGWDAAAPVKFTGNFGKRWNVEGNPLGVLGWSRDDKLIDEPEVDDMAARLSGDGVHTIVIKDLRGGHHEICEDGAGVARLILEALGAIRDP